MANGSVFVRRELMIRFVRAFNNGTLETDLDRFAVEMRPRLGQSSRCCIYHDRAVIKYRLMSLLGFSCEEETDEARTLASYYREAIERETPVNVAETIPLSVCEAGCSGCPSARVIVTPNCRGCLNRPCMYSCPKGAISIVNQVSTIDYSKCINCGKCTTVCPYHAIVKTTVPCEEACPTGAIHKDPDGHTRIDMEKCISCGNCFSKCPFSAILERSQMLDVMKAIKNGEKVVAMIAPAIEPQIAGSIEQLFTAVSKLGFTDVMEVAIGAEETTAREAEEFKEKMLAGERLMTTSCCPAYVELVRKFVPELMKYVSHTPSPMVLAAEIARKEHPGCKVVFVGPCVAKRIEGARNNIDFVLSFEELLGMLAGSGIDIIACEPMKLPRAAISDARGFAKSSGVTQAVVNELGNFKDDFKLDAKAINGIEKKTISILKLYAAGKLPGNFLEVMCCPGGCVNGPCSLKK
ncbi:MAG: 4Fe-4S binding protein [Kiritimatiellae bacterium]|nr:4Fe-4S binding protein [Kiritimatiellia bacterium]